MENQRISSESIYILSPWCNEPFHWLLPVVNLFIHHATNVKVILLVSEKLFTTGVVNKSQSGE